MQKAETARKQQKQGRSNFRVSDLCVDGNQTNANEGTASCVQGAKAQSSARRQQKVTSLQKAVCFSQRSLQRATRQLRLGNGRAAGAPAAGTASATGAGEGAGTGHESQAGPGLSVSQGTALHPTAPHSIPCSTGAGACCSCCGSKSPRWGRPEELARRKSQRTRQEV